MTLIVAILAAWLLGASMAWTLGSLCHQERLWQLGHRRNGRAHYRTPDERLRALVAQQYRRKE